MQHRSDKGVLNGALNLGQQHDASSAWKRKNDKKREAEMLCKRFAVKPQTVYSINTCASTAGTSQTPLFLTFSIDIFCQLTLLQDRFAYLEPQLCACAARGVTLPASQV